MLKWEPFLSSSEWRLSFDVIQKGTIIHPDNALKKNLRPVHIKSFCIFSIHAFCSWFCFNIRRNDVTFTCGRIERQYSSIFHRKHWTTTWKFKPQLYDFLPAFLWSNFIPLVTLKCSPYQKTVEKLYLWQAIKSNCYILAFKFDKNEIENRIVKHVIECKRYVLLFCFVFVFGLIRPVNQTYTVHQFLMRFIELKPQKKLTTTNIDF